ncbi:hypothetical protein C8T65DRAFT_745192 [Cerioporus squamosus]|nr:hypothetical protein C8T65DRAFT_745192 [Cerioporus squamosus]
MPAQAQEQHVKLPPELWRKIFLELGDHWDTLLSATLISRALRGVAQEVLYRVVTVELKEPSRIAPFIVYDDGRRVAALVRRLSLIISSDDSEDYKQKVLGPVYALLAHTVQGAELNLRYLRITSGMLAQLYDVVSDSRQPGTPPPAMAAEAGIGGGAEETGGQLEVKLLGLMDLQELEIVYEPERYREPSAQDAQALEHLCTEYGKSLTTIRLEGVPEGAEHLFAVVYTALGERLVSFIASLGVNLDAAGMAHKVWPVDTLRLDGMHFPALRHLELDERKREWGTPSLPHANVDACLSKS